MKIFRAILCALCGVMLHSHHASPIAVKDLADRLKALKGSLATLSVDLATIGVPQIGTAAEGTITGTTAGSLAGETPGAVKNQLPTGGNFTPAYTSAYSVAYNAAFTAAREKVESEKKEKKEKQAKEDLEKKLKQEPARTWYGDTWYADMMKAKPGASARELELELIVYSLEKIAGMVDPGARIANLIRINTWAAVWMPKPSALTSVEVAKIMASAKNLVGARKNVMAMSLVGSTANPSIVVNDALRKFLDKVSGMDNPDEEDESNEFEE